MLSMKAAVCRFKVEFTSLIKKKQASCSTDDICCTEVKVEVFILHCILSFYTLKAERRGRQLIYVARLFSVEIGTVPFLWNDSSTQPYKGSYCITSTAFYTAVLLLSIFSCPC